VLGAAVIASQVCAAATAVAVVVQAAGGLHQYPELHKHVYRFPAAALHRPLATSHPCVPSSHG